jgi:hypothetical protein
MNKFKGFTPTDILADGIDSKMQNGVMIRKGTIGAILANLDAIDSDKYNSDEKEAAIMAIKEGVPTLIALNFDKHLIWKNPLVQKMMEDYRNNNV